MSWVSPDHPRAKSLKIREKLAEGFRMGLVVPEGLAAHGRGEAFDYILGERTTEEARDAIDAAAAMLLLAKKPVISVNGNVAALVPGEMVELSRILNAKLEVNLFHGSKERYKAIAEHLVKHGAREVLGAEEEFSTTIDEVHSDRRRVDSRGIAIADVVLVPLEDGDRTEALKRLGKKVIAIDLNPMSRTALAADVTIVDNIVRASPLLIETVERMSAKSEKELKRVLENFDNSANLKKILEFMSKRLKTISTRKINDAP